MTYEEALKELRGNYVLTNGTVKGKPLFESIGVAIEALEKQIPEKPVIQFDPPYENPTDDEPWYLCPCCMNANIMYPEHHCECGQRLDWSEFRYPEKELEKWKKKSTIEEFVGLEGYK